MSVEPDEDALRREVIAMSPEHKEALRLAIFANLELLYKRGHRLHTAAGLLAYAQALVGDAVIDRLAFAQILREATAEAENGIRPIDPRPLSAIVQSPGTCGANII